MSRHSTTGRAPNQASNPPAPPAKPLWHVRGEVLDPNRGTLLMGIVNTTPDSFSDGGRFVDEDRAVAHGLLLRDEGAHLVDVGGCSTRPGAEDVDEAEELRRVIGVVGRLAAEGVRVSIDTSKLRVAAEAIEAGAVVVNDVAALEEQGMAELCAATGVGVVLMHRRGNPRTMQQDPTYDDVVQEVRDYLRDRVAAVEAAGVDRRAIAIDPGIGFGKTLIHNLALLNGLPILAAEGVPVMAGTSRKAFLGALTGRPIDGRDAISAVSAGICAVQGASIVRVHDVPYTRDALALADAMVQQMGEG